MASFADLKRAVIELLGDQVGEDAPIEGPNTPATVLKEGCHAALIAVSERHWKSSILEVEASEDLSVESPEDLISVETVYDNALAILIPKLFFQVGQSLSASNQNSWSEWPHGLISFENAMSEGGKVFYAAYWPLPEEDNDEIEIPAFCYLFVQLFMVSYCLMRQANEQGLIKQFATKVDSGTPLTMPAEQLSNFFAKRAEAELQRIPMKQKGVH